MVVSVEPPAVRLGPCTNAEQHRISFTITNPAHERRTVSLASQAVWLQAIPGPYVIGPGKSLAISAQVDTRMLVTAGLHQDHLIVGGVEPPVLVPVQVEIVPPFFIDPATGDSDVATLADVLRYIDRRWRSAAQQQGRHRVTAALRFVGASALADELVQHMRTLPSADLALEALMRTQRGPASLPPEAGNWPQLCRRIARGQRPTLRWALKLRNPNRRGLLAGEATAQVAWLAINPAGFSLGPGETGRVGLELPGPNADGALRQTHPGTPLISLTTYGPGGQPEHRVVLRRPVAV